MTLLHMWNMTNSANHGLSPLFWFQPLPLFYVFVLLRSRTVKPVSTSRSLHLLFPLLFTLLTPSYLSNFSQSLISLEKCTKFFFHGFFKKLLSQTLCNYIVLFIGLYIYLPLPLQSKSCCFRDHSFPNL